MPSKNPKPMTLYVLNASSSHETEESAQGSVRIAPSKRRIPSGDSETKESNKKPKLEAMKYHMERPDTMAYGIVCNEVQDHLLTDCYKKLNNQKYVGKFVDYKHHECDESFHLLHIIDDFTEDSKEMLMSNMKYWVKFEQEFPYINTSRIALDHLYKMSLSRGFLQYLANDKTKPKVAKVISVGKISHCCLVSTEQVNVKETIKSVKQVKFQFLSQEMELACACVCHVFNRGELTCNIWNGEFTAGSKFGQPSLIGIPRASVRNLPDVPNPSVFIPIYDIRKQSFTSDDLKNDGLKSIPYFKKPDLYFLNMAGHVQRYLNRFKASFK
ncbi:hypothetical protein BDP27DRAFT_1429057 [Rhodocollybia butyracea]|uniref:Uncharacterized protein n=1 Tax=Rhodocollybia butyracea TaxID=206335 RepID=A0A9P5PES7_9AGAR|nr:hypothetical protein BDP27DRAFT_1429057 [Rhodocollybia butyracea]